MSKYIFVCVLLASVAMSNGAPSWWSNIGNLFQKFPENVAKAGNIIIATVTKPVLNQCNNVKSMMGMTFSKINGTDKEPNLDELTLDFLSPVSNQSFKLPSAARDILEHGVSAYNASRKVFVFCHGWNSNPEHFDGIKNALHNTGNGNLLVLNSASFVQKIDYVSISSYAMYMGEKLAEVLAEFYKVGLNPQDIHILGHSYGGHVAGFTGKVFQALTGRKIGRITGLDPSGPCFIEISDAERLYHTDADFVDVIHTNDGLSGIDRAIGHADFYPNGGGNQPGCMSIPCSHQRVSQLFAESITNPEAFMAVKCDSWNKFKAGDCADGEVVRMGFGATADHTGTYFLQTTGKSPFGLEMSGTKYNRFLPL